MPAAAKAAPLVIRTLDVGGRRLRVGTRLGESGVPLLIFNGIGANLELVEPLTTALAGIGIVVFDVPGVGGSPAPQVPYRLWWLARLADRLLTVLGHNGQVDVLGISWGGGLAQQFALQYPRRCRRLVLAATGAGALMLPGRFGVLSKMIDPRRYRDPAYLRRHRRADSMAAPSAHARSYLCSTAATFACRTGAATCTSCSRCWAGPACRGCGCCASRRS